MSQLFSGKDINQYVTTIMGGREVSRPYRAFTTLRFVGRHR